MKSIVSILIALLLTITISNAQQWIAKDYTFQTEANVVYGSATTFNNGTESLNLDLYLPDCDDQGGSAKRPLLIWIHGGAFIAGSKNDPSIINLCEEFAKRGYVTASINYRKGFVNDDAAWNCNYPNYSCVWASDAAEWQRAYYRAIQDGKGAVRYLVNNHEQYGIDTDNIFVAGESAGAFIALGVALLDSENERPAGTYVQPDTPLPNANTLSCQHNQNQSFSGTGIARPDLGNHEGNISPTNINFTIKAVGNMFGAMLGDLLAYHNPEKPKPGIYSFHRPCDLIVPIDDGPVFEGLSWCFTNGYGCIGVGNTTTVFGSRAIHNWNENNSYGYNIQNEFTSVEFPYNYWFGAGSCIDQVSNGCHAYDNKTLRENNLAAFFAPYITTNPVCLPETVTTQSDIRAMEKPIIFPNPASQSLNISFSASALMRIEIFDICGRICLVQEALINANYSLDISTLTKGIYFVSISQPHKPEHKTVHKLVVH